MSTPYDAWFILADEDRDGKIAGAEAVRFFQRSGLAQECLGQIWELSSAGGPALNKIQFSVAMRLVSLSQTSGGRLPIEQARALVAGVGPAVGPPRMQGLDGGGAPPVAGGYSPQVTGGSQAYTPQTTGGGGYAAQTTGGGGYATQTTGGGSGYTAQTTGGGGYAPQYGYQQPAQPTYSPQVTGGSVPVAQYGQPPVQPYAQPAGQQYAQPGAQPGGRMPGQPAPGAGGFVAATPADITRYQGAFVKLDTDLDGYVKGSDCFGFFLQWGLDKTLLRDIWAVVAGNAGQLDRQQFVSCLYLMDAAKQRGTPPPTTLPPGPFPPVASAAMPPAQWSLHSQFGVAGAAAATAAPPAMQLPTFSPLPPRVDFLSDTAGEAAGAAFTSKAPQVASDTMASFNAAEKAKLAAELKQAEERETRQHAAEEEAARARAKQAAYNAALQDLLVFKSRMDIGLLQAQDQSERLKADAEDIKRRYDQTYARAQTQNAEANKLRETMSKLMGEKDEAEEKLRLLESEIATAGQLTPEAVTRKEGELRLLMEKVSAAEAEHSAKATALEGHRKQREALQKQLAEAQATAAETAAEAEAAQKEVEQIAAQVAIARASGNSTLTSELLIKTSAAYTRLVQQAARCGLELPAQAHLAALPTLTWFNDVVAGTADWNDEEDLGFVFVNALPGQQTPRAVQAAKAASGDGARGEDGALLEGGGLKANLDKDFIASGAVVGGTATSGLSRGTQPQAQLSEMGAAASAAAAAAAAIAALFPRFTSTDGGVEEEAPAFKPFVEGKGFGGGATRWDDNFATPTTDFGADDQDVAPELPMSPTQQLGDNSSASLREHVGLDTTESGAGASPGLTSPTAAAAAGGLYDSSLEGHDSFPAASHDDGIGASMQQQHQSGAFDEEDAAFGAPVATELTGVTAYYDEALATIAATPLEVPVTLPPGPAPAPAFDDNAF